MTNEELVLRIQTGEDEAGSMEALYQQIHHFIHAIAWQYRDSGEMEDLEQEGYLALQDAIKGYDIGRGYKFLTYADKWIRQRMRRYLQYYGSCLRLPVCSRERLRKYKRLCSSFYREYGRGPSDREAAAAMDLTLEQIEDIKKTAAMGPCSLDEPINGLEDEGLTRLDAVAAPGSLEDDVIDKVQAEQLKEALWDCVDALPGRQPQALRMRYQDNMTLNAIARIDGTTSENLRQIHNKALRELRMPRYSRRLLPYLEDSRLYSMGLRGNGVGTFNHTWTSSTERAALKLLEDDFPK